MKSYINKVCYIFILIYFSFLIFGKVYNDSLSYFNLPNNYEIFLMPKKLFSDEEKLNVAKDIRDFFKNDFNEYYNLIFSYPKSKELGIYEQNGYFKNKYDIDYNKVYYDKDKLENLESINIKDILNIEGAPLNFQNTFLRNVEEVEVSNLFNQTKLPIYINISTENIDGVVDFLSDDFDIVINHYEGFNLSSFFNLFKYYVITGLVVVLFIYNYFISKNERLLVKFAEIILYFIIGVIILFWLNLWSGYKLYKVMNLVFIGILDFLIFIIVKKLCIKTKYVVYLCVFVHLISLILLTPQFVNNAKNLLGLNKGAFYVFYDNYNVERFNDSDLNDVMNDNIFLVDNNGKKINEFEGLENKSVDGVFNSIRYYKLNDRDVLNINEVSSKYGYYLLPRNYSKYNYEYVFYILFYITINIFFIDIYVDDRKQKRMVNL